MKNFVESYYFDRWKLTKKTTPSINIPFSSKVGTKIETLHLNIYPHTLLRINNGNFHLKY